MKAANASKSCRNETATFMSEIPTSPPLDQAAAVEQARILMQALPHMLHYDEASWW